MPCRLRRSCLTPLRRHHGKSQRHDDDEAGCQGPVCRRYVQEEEDVGDNTLLELGIMASLPADNSTPLEPEAPKKQANFVKIAENELRKHVLCRNNLNKQVDLGNPANQDETDSTCEIQNENSSDATKSTLIFDSTHTETSCFESTNLTNTPTMSKSFKNSLDKIELTHFKYNSGTYLP